MKLKTLTFVVGLILLASSAGQAQEPREQIEAIIRGYLLTDPDEVGEIAKEYLIKHPEAVGEILVEVLKRRSAAAANSRTSTGSGARRPAAPDRDAAVANNAGPLFSSTHQVTLGNPEGDVTLVEFFDYSCGYCKRALPDIVSLLNTDPKLKVVLKAFPILGPGSAAAARVAVAVRMQDPGGQRYLAFHERLLSENGPANEEKALAAARDEGLDMARLAQDMTSEEIGATLAESAKLASALGIKGTPGYVIGNSVVFGAVGATALRTRIGAARSPGMN